MSNYHILSADSAGNKFQVVFHVPIPDQLNDVDFSYRTALVDYQGGASNIASVLANPGTELTQMQAGELYEVISDFNSNPNESLAEKRTRLDIDFANVSSDALAELQTILSFWGYERDVP